MAKNAKSKVGFMSYLNYISMGCVAGLIAAFLLALIFNFIKLLIRSFPEFYPFRWIRSRVIKFKSLKVEELGYRVYMYVSWVDGKHIRIKDMEKEEKLKIKDPIVFEQHAYRNIPFQAGVGCIAFNKENNNVIGKAFRINSDSNEIRELEIKKISGEK